MHMSEDMFKTRFLQASHWGKYQLVSHPLLSNICCVVSSYMPTALKPLASYSVISQWNNIDSDKTPQVIIAQCLSVQCEKKMTVRAPTNLRGKNTRV